MAFVSSVHKYCLQNQLRMFTECEFSFVSSVLDHCLQNQLRMFTEWELAFVSSVHDLCLQNQLSGYLLRKFNNSNGWQKLWVVFTNFCLYFYKTYQVCPCIWIFICLFWITSWLISRSARLGTCKSRGLNSIKEAFFLLIIIV